MKMNLATLLVVLSVLPASSCSHSAVVENSCAAGDGAGICHAPFEAIYSSREKLMNHNVRLDGVLIVGFRSDPPESQKLIALLFPSAERAQMCNPKFAIEVVANSDSLSDALEDYSGRFVSVAGRLTHGKFGAWARIELARPPALLSGEKIESSCMQTPPPTPPGNH